MTNSIKSIAMPTASTANANTYSDPNGLAALKKDPNSPQALRAVAQQVDALFLQMMLKSMRDASAAVGESDSNEMGMYQDMFVKQVALNVSQHQNLGLGALLTRQLGDGNAPGVAAPPAKSGLPGSVPATTAPVRSQMPAVGPVSSMSIAQAAGEFVAQVM